MGLALVKQNEMNRNGVRIEDFEEALVRLDDMARITEQRLTVKVDNYINEQYKTQYLAMEEVKKFILSR